MRRQAADTASGFTGMILAGGGSTRFGAPKAEVHWQGRSLLAHVVDCLRGCCREVVAVARTDQSTQGWPVDRIVCDDLSLPEGPLRGIIAGLAACRTAQAMVVACDTPCLQTALLTQLQRGLDADTDAYVAEWDGRPQPLVGTYQRDARDVLAAALAGGEVSPRRALLRLRVKLLGESECRRLDPLGLSFFNLNTPEDLARLEAALRHERPAARVHHA